MSKGTKRIRKQEHTLRKFNILKAKTNNSKTNCTNAKRILTLRMFKLLILDKIWEDIKINLKISTKKEVVCGLKHPALDRKNKVIISVKSGNHLSPDRLNSPKADPYEQLLNNKKIKFNNYEDLYL